MEYTFNIENLRKLVSGETNSEYDSQDEISIYHHWKRNMPRIEVSQAFPEGLAKQFWPECKIETLPDGGKYTLILLGCPSEGFTYALEWLKKSVDARAWQPVRINWRRNKILPEMRLAAVVLGIAELKQRVDEDLSRDIEDAAVTASR